MITAERLKTLTSFTAQGLTEAIRKAGYKKDSFTGAKFLGMTNGGEFCYSATYVDEFEDTECNTKVYISYDPTVDRVSAGY